MGLSTDYRYVFGSDNKFLDTIPNLIKVQIDSYNNFLQSHIPVDQRKDIGLQDVFKSIFPIKDMSERCILEFVNYEFEEPKLDPEECKRRDTTYESPLKLLLRLTRFDKDEETGAIDIISIKEQIVYICSVPIMTDNGTFIINGTERVIVSQMHRSPGAFFDHDYGRTHISGKYLYSARIIPYRGSWLDFEFDPKELLYFRIDRKKKLPVTLLLKALGYNNEQIIKEFYEFIEIKKENSNWIIKFNPEDFKGLKLDFDLIDGKTNKLIVEKDTKLNPRIINKLISEQVEWIKIEENYLFDNFLAESIINEDTNETVLEIGSELNNYSLGLINELGIKSFKIMDISKSGLYIRDTLAVDKCISEEEALIEIFKIVRTGEPASLDAARYTFESLFFDNTKYDLSDVGRLKMNLRLNEEIDLNLKVLTKQDITNVIKRLIKVKDGEDSIDDIDHLGNRRVRSVGELVENQFRIGMVRLEKAILEKMSTTELDSAMPHDLVNSKPLNAILKEFFGTSQLSQFMDQTNPLSEVAHKRRLSALGPGGLTRDRATFQVRDVHASHYGRICPVETPEGQNVGLINSLSTYARVNKYGFIETPYRKVENSKVTDVIEYLSAIEEEKYTIAQANARLDSENSFIDDAVSCRRKGEFLLIKPDEIDYIDVVPMQLVSVAASLIPFLENDDANRALMGSNMQRQAVPLVRAEAPLVGTGMESLVARDSGVVVIAKRDGIVDQVDNNRIVIRSTEELEDKSSGVDIYNLIKFRRSNYNTCINQTPLVKVGAKVKKGDIIADGPSTDKGELALGRNVLAAFMPWNGYNFEDAILISERLVKEDVFTSIHIEEFEVVARDTRLGPEEITRDIPNVSEDALKNIDEVGIIHIGSEVKPGDILVGKVTPKSESPVSPEEKLLRAIFGEKAADTKDSSLRVPSGISGKVIDVRVFTRRGVDKDERAVAIEREQIDKITKDIEDERIILESSIYDRVSKLLEGKRVVEGPKNVKEGIIITQELLEQFSKYSWWKFVVDDASVMEKINSYNKQLKQIEEKLGKRLKESISKIKAGDDLVQGALKVVKVFLAVKRKLQPGDKMAGRHGNKGVVSKILPVEDMPYLEDGTPVDMVLNPIGVPSRMNIGQVMEIHLGWASANLGKQVSNIVNEVYNNNDTSDLRNYLKEVYAKKHYQEEIDNLPDQEIIQLSKSLSKGVPMATPVFDGAKEKDIERLLELAKVDKSAQVDLYDGRTGEKFDRKVTVGYIYMLKLHHLVEDKIHARSIGPYSLVTQQPLGGKSHFGGQRFGEMECWALQAYGAAYTLQEMLTVKSDDVSGRIKMYEAIVRDDCNFDSNIPESFNVMLKELKSLCLKVELESDDV